jgi:hypothetical protein
MQRLLFDFWIFLLTLSIKLKALDEIEFIDLLRQLDYQQKIYAMWLRYFI